jgi:hypothetical protein
MIDMSNKELKTASTACAIAMEIARNRLGRGEISPELMLAGYTKTQLDEFVRVCRELERDFERNIRYVPEGSVKIVLPEPPELPRISRERRGGYHGEE